RLGYELPPAQAALRLAGKKKKKKKERRGPAFWAMADNGPPKGEFSWPEVEKTAWQDSNALAGVTQQWNFGADRLVR
ncbi:hypothetical protein J3F84DRAFT_390989, partial [Trichoderma pleuroticola]